MYMCFEELSEIFKVGREGSEEYTYFVPQTIIKSCDSLVTFCSPWCCILLIYSFHTVVHEIGKKQIHWYFCHDYMRRTLTSYFQVSRSLTSAWRSRELLRQLLNACLASTVYLPLHGQPAIKAEPFLFWGSGSAWGKITALSLLPTASLMRGVPDLHIDSCGIIWSGINGCCVPWARRCTWKTLNIRRTVCS